MWPAHGRKATAITDLDYCPLLCEMVESGRAELPSGEKIPISATSTLNNLRVIRHFILAEKPEETIEIGLAFGASALAILASLAEVNKTGFNHTAIDPFQTTAWKSVALHSIESAGFADHFTYLEQESALVYFLTYVHKAKNTV
jgi:predicted O-methyltransferase YrrM